MSLPKKAAAAGAALGMAAATLAVAAPASAASNYILNASNIGVGVIHVRDGNYTRGNYDTVLAAGHRTSEFWANAAGYYIGPGYCGYEWILTGGSWLLTDDSVDPGQHFISTTQTIRVVAERC
ncbi:hypothetical protein M8C17_00870 [Micromonospora sp. RHAY321]|uniref:hypothetical protein n=1 Tax=Micromonospora sp. RHAY321 TaxID=2944807 RepID=UPI00207CB775|nr:hypothetical protein [Micromonospora sp. RHAY321]MCO1593718.1 hypothetical protein [Micromonospora sp. RHAY321]